MTDTPGTHTPTPLPLPLPASVTRRVSPVVAVGALVALAFVGAGLLVATLFAPSGRDTTVVIGFVVSIIGPTVLTLLALIRGDHAAKLGASNAEKLDATIATVEKVAHDVNGHLQRHDELAANVMEVANGVAQAAGLNAGTPRNPQARTRSSDEHLPQVTDVQAAPLGEQV
jgi:hypothetical protein